MDGGTVGIMSLVVVNIALVAFSYGRLSQKVSDLCRRVNRVEAIINGRNPGGGKDEK